MALMSPGSVILTGASDGIGKAMALEFARRGWSLGLIARRTELLEQVRDRCLRSGAPRVFFRSVDVSDEPAFETALDALDTELGGATAFIANAGITGRSSLGSDAWSSAKKILQVNVLSAIHGLEVMKMKMLARGSGTLAGVSSIAGARGMPTSGAYATSKAALTNHLEGLRVDLKSRGIRVVTIVPGFIRTSLTTHNKGKMPFLMEPEDAARVFVSGVIRGRSWSIAPAPFRVIYPVIQMLPRSWFDFLMTRLYRTIRG
jgi:short-subunit dehydrogenase